MFWTDRIIPDPTSSPQFPNSSQQCCAGTLQQLSSFCFFHAFIVVVTVHSHVHPLLVHRSKLTIYRNSCTLGETNRLNSLADKSYKNGDKGEFDQKFWKIIDASENHMYIYIYIHGLTDRIFNTATKQQNQFHLQVFPSTVFGYLLFLTYPKKMILFYVLVTEYIYIYIYMFMMAEDGYWRSWKASYSFNLPRLETNAEGK